MEPEKNTKLLDTMWRTGQPTALDPTTGYKYSMVARCPVDGANATVAQVYRQGQSIDHVIFQCSACANEFQANRADILVY
jgi:hypothetical protein